MKLDFKSKTRTVVEAMGAGGAIKKVHSMLELADLGKLEASATITLTGKFTLLSLADNKDQHSNAYSVTMTR